MPTNTITITDDDRAAYAAMAWQGRRDGLAMAVAEQTLTGRAAQDLADRLDTLLGDWADDHRIGDTADDDAARAVQTARRAARARAVDAYRLADVARANLWVCLADHPGHPDGWPSHLPPIHTVAADLVRQAEHDLT